MKRIFFRLVLLAAGVFYLAAVAVNGAGQWLLEHRTREHIGWGVAWNPGNPSLWTEQAWFWLFDPRGFQPQKAVEAYLRAASMNPLDPDNWEGLATAYLQLREPAKSEQALRAATAALPHSPEVAWHLANFLLLEGRSMEALPFLRRAATYAPEMRAAVFDLGWKILTDPDSILRELVPPGPEARTEYLRFLLARKKLQEADAVWQELRQQRSKPVLALGYYYVEALALAGQGAEAARLWGQMLADGGRTGAKPEGELLTNGDFEAELVNAGLDWRVLNGGGYEVAVDNFAFQHGSRSLRVVFDGSANLDFAAVWQFVPVEPGQRYQFRGYLKTENITTDNGLSFYLSSIAAPPGESLALSTPNRIGTEPWLPEQLEFRTGPNTRVVAVALRRPKSQKFNNLIRGRVWIDNLSVQKIPQ